MAFCMTNTHPAFARTKAIIETALGKGNYADAEIREVLNTLMVGRGIMAEVKHNISDAEIENLAQLAARALVAESVDDYVQLVENSEKFYPKSAEQIFIDVENALALSEERVKKSDDFETDHTYYYIDENGNQHQVEESVTEHIRGEKSKGFKGNTATDLGNLFDGYVRSYFAEGTITRDGRLTDAEHEHIKSQIEDFRKYLDHRFGNGKYKVFTREVPLVGRFLDAEYKGTELVAGTFDMLVVDDQGNAYIFDMKTKSKELTERDSLEYARQLNLYRQLLQYNFPGLFKSINMGLLIARTHYTTLGDSFTAETEREANSYVLDLQMTQTEESAVPEFITTFNSLQRASNVTKYAEDNIEGLLNTAHMSTPLGTAENLEVVMANQYYNEIQTSLRSFINHHNQLADFDSLKSYTFADLMSFMDKTVEDPQLKEMLQVLNSTHANPEDFKSLKVRFKQVLPSDKLIDVFGDTIYVSHRLTSREGVTMLPDAIVNAMTYLTLKHAFSIDSKTGDPTLREDVPDSLKDYANSLIKLYEVLKISQSDIEISEKDKNFLDSFDTFIKDVARTADLSLQFISKLQDAGVDSATITELVSAMEQVFKKSVLPKSLVNKGKARNTFDIFRRFNTFRNNYAQQKILEEKTFQQMLKYESAGSLLPVEAVIDSNNAFSKKEIEILFERNTTVESLHQGNIAQSIQEFKDAIKSAIFESEEIGKYDLNKPRVDQNDLVHTENDEDYRLFIEALSEDIISRLDAAGYTISIKPKSTLNSSMAVKVTGKLIELTYHPSMIAVEGKRLDYIVAHELVHVVTAKAVDNWANGSATKEEQIFVNSLWDIVNDLKDKYDLFWDMNIDFSKKENQATYLKEFISNVMTNATLQKALAKVKTGEKSSIWKKICDLFKDLFDSFLGTDVSGTYLEKLIETIYLHIDANLEIGSNSTNNFTEGKIESNKNKELDVILDTFNSMAKAVGISEEVKKELADIKQKAIANGTFMKAPNGLDSKLTERQWLHVRTKAFKKWFGDWERLAELENILGLQQKLQQKFQELYPEIKLTITNNPVFEDSNYFEHIVNQWLNKEEIGKLLKEEAWENINEEINEEDIEEDYIDDNEEYEDDEYDDSWELDVFYNIQEYNAAIKNNNSRVSTVRQFNRFYNKHKSSEKEDVYRESYEYLEELYSYYDAAIGRTSSYRGNLQGHIASGNGLLYEPFAGNNSALVGQLVAEDIFIVSHFVPSSLRKGLELIKYAANDSMPIVMAVPDYQAEQLKKAGFKFVMKIPQEFAGEIVTKNVMINKAVTTEDKMKLLFTYHTRNQENNNQIVGQANLDAMTVLIDAINAKEDTLPHEYAHHYISWFRETDIVKEGIKRFGSEEALVQAVGEQVIKQKGEAYNWWKKFTKWVVSLFSDKDIIKIITDGLLTRSDLNYIKLNDFRGREEIINKNGRSDTRSNVYNTYGTLGELQQEYEELKGKVSKVIDENGEPKPVYHGGAKGVNVFKNSSEVNSNTGSGYYTDPKTGEKIPLDSNSAVFFSEDKYVGKSYAELRTLNKLISLRNKMQSLFSTFEYTGKVAGISADHFKNVTDFLNTLQEASEFVPRFAKLKNYLESILNSGKKVSETLTSKEVLAVRDMLKEIRKILDNITSESRLNTSAFERQVEFSRKLLEKLTTEKGINDLLEGKIPEEILSIYNMEQKIQANRVKEGLSEILNHETVYITLNHSNRIFNSYIIEYDGKSLIFRHSDVTSEYYEGFEPKNASKEQLKKYLNSSYKANLESETYDEFNTLVDKHSQQYEVFLNIKNPLVHDYEGTRQGGGYKESKKYPFGYVAARQVQKALKEGYDGVIYKNLKDPYLSTNYGIFNSNQVKSATDNIGNYSNESNNINEFTEGTIKKVHTDLIQDLGGGVNADQEVRDAVKVAKKGISFKEALAGQKAIFTKEEQAQIKQALNGQNLKVMSVSRMTDPAFFSQRLVKFLEENAKKPFTDPTRVNAIELWTKHDGVPIQDILEACVKYKVAPMVSFSITSLGDTALEKGVLKYKDLLDRIEQLIKTGTLNPVTTTVRIDPILPGFTKLEDIKAIVERSKHLGIKKFVTSLVQSYGYTEGRTNDRKVISGINNALASEGKSYDWDKYYGRDYNGKINFKPKQQYINEIGKFLLELNKDKEIEIETCSFTIKGLKASACLDPLIIERITGIDVTRKDGTYDRDTSRPDCMCYGCHSDMFKMSDKCASSCAYCYAAHSDDSPFSYYNEDGSLKDMPLTQVRYNNKPFTPLNITPKSNIDAKATVKGSISNKFIGYGLSDSATESYRKQAGDKANTGDYSREDTVFVSINGKRGNAIERKVQQDNTIEEAVKALKAGATLITDSESYRNSSAYNEGEKLLAERLKKEGAVYSDKNVNGTIVGQWKLSSIPTTQQTSYNIKAEGKMSFAFNNNQRKEVKSSTTLDAIINKERTATTRYERDGNIHYWKSLKEGDLVEFSDNNGRVVIVRVTKPLTKLSSNTNVETWSKKEGWSKEYFEREVKPKLDEAWQFEYEYISDNTQQPSQQTSTTSSDTQNNNQSINSSVSLGISISSIGYKKRDPQINPNIAYVFTDNAQAYVTAQQQDDSWIENGYNKGNQVKTGVSDMNGTNTAGIRASSSNTYGATNINSNAFGVTVKKYQQKLSSAGFLTKEGQFNDAQEDFELFVKLNEDVFRRLENSGLKQIIFPTQMALGKAALPLRFAEWLQSQLSERFGIVSVIEKSQKADYDGYGIRLQSVNNISNSQPSNKKPSIPNTITIDYTPKGKTRQTYTVKKEGDSWHIYNKDGKEVYNTDCKDRRRILANISYTYGRAVVVNHKGHRYIVNNKMEILNNDGDFVYVNKKDNNGDRLAIENLAKEQFAAKQQNNSSNTSSLNKRTEQVKSIAELNGQSIEKGREQQQKAKEVASRAKAKPVKEVLHTDMAALSETTKLFMSTLGSKEALFSTEEIHQKAESIAKNILQRLQDKIDSINAANPDSEKITSTAEYIKNNSNILNEVVNAFQEELRQKANAAMQDINISPLNTRKIAYISQHFSVFFELAKPYFGRIAGLAFENNNSTIASIEEDEATREILDDVDVDATEAWAVDKATLSYVKKMSAQLKLLCSLLPEYKRVYKEDGEVDYVKDTDENGLIKYVDADKAVGHIMSLVAPYDRVSEMLKALDQDAKHSPWLRTFIDKIKETPELQTLMFVSLRNSIGKYHKTAVSSFYDKDLKETVTTLQAIELTQNTITYNLLDKIKVATLTKVNLPKIFTYDGTSLRYDKAICDRIVAQLLNLRQKKIVNTDILQKALEDIGVDTTFIDLPLLLNPKFEDTYYATIHQALQVIYEIQRSSRKGYFGTENFKDIYSSYYFLLKEMTHLYNSTEKMVFDNGKNYTQYINPSYLKRKIEYLTGAALTNETELGDTDLFGKDCPYMLYDQYGYGEGKDRVFYMSYLNNLYRYYLTIQDRLRILKTHVNVSSIAEDTELKSLKERYRNARQLIVHSSQTTVNDTAYLEQDEGDTAVSMILNFYAYHQFHENEDIPKSTHSSSVITDIPESQNKVGITVPTMSDKKADEMISLFAAYETETYINSKGVTDVRISEAFPTRNDDGILQYSKAQKEVVAKQLQNYYLYEVRRIKQVWEQLKLGDSQSDISVYNLNRKDIVNLINSDPKFKTAFSKLHIDVNDNKLKGFTKDLFIKDGKWRKEFLKSGSSFSFLNIFNEALVDPKNEHLLSAFIDYLNSEGSLVKSPLVKKDATNSVATEDLGDAFNQIIIDYLDKESDNLFNMLLSYTSEGNTMVNGLLPSLLGSSTTEFASIANKQSDEYKSFMSLLQCYVYNTFLNSQNILNMTIGDPAYYKGVIDLQKRFAQIHSNTAKVDVEAKFEHNGKTIQFSADGKCRFIIIEDIKAEMQSVFSKDSNNKTLIDRLFETINNTLSEQLSDAKEGSAARMMIEAKIAQTNAIKQKLSKELSEAFDSTDGQAMSSPTAMWKKLSMLGKSPKGLREAIERLASGKEVNMEDLNFISQVIKPFAYSQEHREQIGIDGNPISINQVPIQLKDSEAMLMLCGALATVYNKNGQIADNNFNKKLALLYDLMEDSAYNNESRDLADYNGRGIDMIVFKSAVKCGSSGAINLNNFETLEELKDAIYDKNGEYKPTTVHEIDFMDWGEQQTITAYTIDGKHEIGSQFRILSVANIDPLLDPELNYNIYTIDENGKLQRQSASWYTQNVIKHYFELLEQDFREGIEDVYKKFNIKEGVEINIKEFNRALQKLLIEASARDAKSDSKITAAISSLCETENLSKFLIPLGNPQLADAVFKAISSEIKKRVNKSQFLGGPKVQVAPVGYSNTLQCLEGKDGGIIMECFITDPGILKDTNILTRLENMAAKEPKPKRKKFIEKIISNINNNVGLGERDIEALLSLELLRESDLEILSYRIPTEDKYSMFRLKIKGFLPKQSGETIILPTAATKLSGFDFDIDKLFILRKFNLVGKYNVYKSLLENGKIEQAEKIKKELDSEIRKNNIFEIIWAALGTKSATKDQLNSGEFNILKQLAKEYAPAENNLNVGLPTTRSYLYRQNSGGATFVGIAAANNVSHSICSFGKIQFSLPTYVRGLIAVNNKGQDVILHESFSDENVKIDRNLIHFDPVFSPIDGSSLSRTISMFVGASADNAKEATLGLLNINKDTANELMFYLRLGIPVVSAIHLINISNIVHKNNFNIRAIETTVKIPNESTLKKISEHIRNRQIVVEDITKETIESLGLKDEAEAINTFNSILALKELVKDFTSDIMNINSVVSLNSTKNALSADPYENLATAIKLKRIFNRQGDGRNASYLFTDLEEFIAKEVPFLKPLVECFTEVYPTVGSQISPLFGDDFVNFLEEFADLGLKLDNIKEIYDIYLMHRAVQTGFLPKEIREIQKIMYQFPYLININKKLYNTYIFKGISPSMISKNEQAFAGKMLTVNSSLNVFSRTAIADMAATFNSLPDAVKQQFIKFAYMKSGFNWSPIALTPLIPDMALINSKLVEGENANTAYTEIFENKELQLKPENGDYVTLRNLILGNKPEKLKLRPTKAYSNNPGDIASLKSLIRSGKGVYFNRKHHQVFIVGFTKDENGNTIYAVDVIDKVGINNNLIVAIDNAHIKQEPSTVQIKIDDMSLTIRVNTYTRNWVVSATATNEAAANMSDITKNEDYKNYAQQLEKDKQREIEEANFIEDTIQGDLFNLELAKAMQQEFSGTFDFKGIDPSIKTKMEYITKLKEWASNENNRNSAIAKAINEKWKSIMNVVNSEIC